MFDGNHRIRRDINLSGNRRRRTVAPPKNFLTGVEDRKAAILENSRRQREQRRLHQQKIKCATIIEKVVRGWLLRSFLVKELQKGFLTSTPIMAIELSILVTLTNGYKDALLAYSKQRFALKSKVDESISLVSKQRILQSALKVLRADAEKENLLQLMQHMLEESENQISNSTCSELITTCQYWMVNHSNEMATIESLWRWSCQAAASTSNKKTLALLGLTLFGYSECIDYQSVAADIFGAENPNRWSYQVLLDALVEKIVASDEDITKMIKDYESKVVCRSIKLYEALVGADDTPSPHVITSLIESVLSLSGEATFLTVLQIRGENIRSIVLEGVNDDLKQSPIEDDDSDDDEMKDVSTFPGQSNHPNQTRISPRLTRQQVQTIPRLNQLYQDDLWRIRQETLFQLEGRSIAHKTSLVELAEYLGNAKLWQQWAEIKTEGSGNLKLLGRLLQGCSGFKSTATSPFLSQLTYSKTFIETLWRQTLLLLVNGSKDEDLTLYTTIVFCDVFSHHLISLSDKHFLECYTTANSKPIILAEHVVSYLKPLLHDLYWNKPVVAADVKAEENVANLRARMLLSGTKLWNALYERWSRLVRQAPFCDESCWFFPRLASRDDDSAVIGSRENNISTTGHNDDDYMEIDSDSDVEEITGTELENDALADTFRDPKMARVLTSIPQAIPFDRRVKLFNSLLNADKLKTQDESADFRRAIARMMERGDDNDMDIGGRERVEIHRDAMYKDSFSQLNGLGRRLKSKVQVTMINKHGTQEAGIDGGGVFKEFLDDLISEAFLNEDDGDAPQLFSVTPLQTLAVNMDAATKIDILAHYEFLGRVLGKAVYESILVEPQFCLPFLNQLLGKLNSLEDLKNVDPEFYTNLTKLRAMSESDIKNLGLTFEINMGSKQTVPLVPGGSSVSVTKQNVIHYIHLVANQRLNVESSRQTKAFLRGFRDLIPASWVRLFSAYELQKLLGGDDTVLDIEKLKVCMQYSGGYHPSQPIIQWFWELVEEFTQDQQRQFLRFVTSCSRQPLLGFQVLEPAPCIQQIHLPDALLGSENTKKHVPLPTSSTCMNLLKLPNYKDKALLRKKLIDAIEAGSGFELT